MGNQQSSGGGDDALMNHVAKGIEEKRAQDGVGRLEDPSVDELTKVTAYLTDDGIMQLCGNPTTDFDKNPCLIRYVNKRDSGRVALKLDPIVSDLTKKVPKTQDILKKMFAQKVGGVTEGALKTVEGYCAEGSMCGAPVLGRPLWVWLLALFVILIAIYGLKHN
jgi:hypothetical protein